MDHGPAGLVVVGADQQVGEAFPPRRRRTSSFMIRSYSTDDSQLIPPNNPMVRTPDVRASGASST
jgi:hypothetical protein